MENAGVIYRHANLPKFAMARPAHEAKRYAEFHPYRKDSRADEGVKENGRYVERREEASERTGGDGGTRSLPEQSLLCSRAATH